MPKPRVYELARELGLSSQEIIEKLKAMGIEAKAPSSSVDEDQAIKFKRHVRLEGQSAKKSRVYGSEEDEGERDAIEKQREARIAAERAEREAAAREAEKERAARKAGVRPKAAAPAPPAVRLAPRVATKPVEPVVESPAEEKPVPAESVTSASVHHEPAPALPAPPPPTVVSAKAPINVAPIGRARKAQTDSEAGLADATSRGAETHDALPRGSEGEATAFSDDGIETGVPAVGPSAAPVRMTSRPARRLDEAAPSRKERCPLNPARLQDPSW